jgi:hypothetical protein
MASIASIWRSGIPIEKFVRLSFEKFNEAPSPSRIAFPQL